MALCRQEFVFLDPVRQCADLSVGGCGEELVPGSEGDLLEGRTFREADRNAGAVNDLID